MADQEWYYNPHDGTVVEGKEGGWDDRMGPYASEAEARDALKKAEARTKEADAYDEEDDNWGKPPAWEK